MIYPYICPNCSHETEVIKSYRDIENDENCPKCDKIMDRTISRFQAVDGTAASDWNAKEYNPAFGKAVTPQEANREAKARGWTATGTEPAEKIQKHFKAQRDKKEKDRWDSLNTNLGEIK